MKVIIILILVLVACCIISSITGAFLWLGNGTPSTTPPQSEPEPPQEIIHSLNPLETNSTVANNTRDLSNHNISCPDFSSVNSFQTVTDPEWKLHYNYNCIDNFKPTTIDYKTTEPQADGNGNPLFLDRHDIDCGSGSVLGQFKLVQNPTDATQYYSYTCHNTENPECRQVTTPFNDDGGGHIHYLNRHNVKCEPNEALQQFKLVRNPDNLGQYQYQYTCKYQHQCQYQTQFKCQNQHQYKYKY